MLCTCPGARPFQRWETLVKHNTKRSGVPLVQQWFRPMGTQRTWGQHARHCLLIAAEDVIEEERRPERLQDDLLCWAFGMTGAVQAREREREREKEREREREP